MPIHALFLTYNKFVSNLINIQKLLTKYNLQATKKWGQNFLIDPFIVESTVAKSGAHNENVIEIGPGLGSLSCQLLAVAKTLTAYEIDPRMIKVLNSEINDAKFKLIANDFLKVDLKNYHNAVIVANIPYNITSLILFRIFEHINHFKSATLMVQKEVAERLLASVNSSNYGKLSVTTQLLAKVSKVIDVPATAFWPKPKVDSMVVKLDFKDVSYDKELINFIKQCFLYPRKKLSNNLKVFLSQAQITKIYEKLALNLNIRPQQLKVEDFVKIYRLI